MMRHYSYWILHHLLRFYLPTENTAKTILLSLPLVVIVGHQQQASSSFQQCYFVKHIYCLDNRWAMKVRIDNNTGIALKIDFTSHLSTAFF